MGVTLATARFLVEARQRGVRFDRTLMLGRQSLLANPLRLHAMLGRGRAWADDDAKQRFLGHVEERGFADPLFHALGGKVVDSMDASPYEGASVIHDLNEPVTDGLRGRYSLVFDGGTLEHVFNVPVALANAMEMVEPGGHLISYVPANNHFGHGFYQFSPELFYRALAPANGFEVERMVVFESELDQRRVAGIPYEYERTGRWHEVRDPRVHRRRHALVTRRPLDLLVLARRTADVRPFAAWPQQSDYAATWSDRDGAGAQTGSEPPPEPVAPGGSSVIAAVGSRLPAGWKPRAWAAATAALALALRPFDRARRWAWTWREASLSNRDMFPPSR